MLPGSGSFDFGFSFVRLPTFLVFLVSGPQIERAVAEFSIGGSQPPILAARLFALGLGGGIAASLTFAFALAQAAYHVEFKVDHDKKEATVYILGSDGKSPQPVKADKIHLVIDDPQTELDLVAQPLEGEESGTSSRFVGTHDTIGIVKEFSGTITGEVEGTPYVGEFKEEPHGADHKH